MGYVLFRSMEEKSMKKKLIRITTVPISLKILLTDQLSFMNKHFDVIGVSSDGNELKEVEEKEGIKTIDRHDEIILKPNSINKNIKISRW